MKWLEELKEKTSKADKFPLSKTYDEIKSEIDEVASFGQYFHYFDYDYMNDEIREKLRKEGLRVTDVMQIGKTKVSWEETEVH